MKKSISWLLFIYLTLLLCAAILGCLSYKIIQSLVVIWPCDLLNYLSKKPLAQYVDRWRLIGFLCIIPLGMRFFDIRWSQWLFPFKWRIFILNMIKGIVLWFMLLGCVVAFTKPLTVNVNVHISYVGIFFASFTIAVLEEWIFRGFFFEVLNQRCTIFVSQCLLGLIFALLHFSKCAHTCSSVWLFVQSLQCAYHSVVDIFSRIQWTYFLCLFFLNGILVHLRLIYKSLWACIGFHQGLVFILMVLRKQYAFNSSVCCFWGTGRLTDSWFVVGILGLIYIYTGWCVRKLHEKAH